MLKSNSVVENSLKRFFNHRDFIAKGKSLAEESIFIFPAFSAFQLKFPIDWTVNPFNDRSWQWRLNNMFYLGWLIAYHGSAANDKILDLGRMLITSWWETWKDTSPGIDFEFAWHDHGTALRAEYIIFFIYYIQQSHPEYCSMHNEFFATANEMLLNHARILNEESFYNRHTNHGLEQSRVLMLLSGCLQSDECEKFKNTAISRIKDEFEFSFTEDGVHKENSPGYHCFMMYTFMEILKNYPAELQTIQAGFEQKLNKGVEFLTHILRPDASYPNLGDSDLAAPADWYQETLGDQPVYEHFLYARHRGQRGKKPEKNKLVLPDSGYAIYRNKWQDAGEWQKTIHLVIKGGPKSKFHYHRDEGSIILYAWGEDWLIDGGMYNHNAKDPIRKYMRSPYAHNVAILNKHLPANVYSVIENAGMSVAENNDVDLIRLNLPVFKDVAYQRDIEIDNSTLDFNVIDIFQFKDKEIHKLTVKWHFPVDKQIECKKNYVLVRGKTKILKIESIKIKPTEISLGRGIVNKCILSCISKSVNKLEDSQCVTFSYDIKSGTEIKNRLTFMDL